MKHSQWFSAVLESQAHQDLFSLYLKVIFSIFCTLPNSHLSNTLKAIIRLAVPDANNSEVLRTVSPNLKTTLYRSMVIVAEWQWVWQCYIVSEQWSYFFRLFLFKIVYFAEFKQARAHTVILNSRAHNLKFLWSWFLYYSLAEKPSIFALPY